MTIGFPQHRQRSVIARAAVDSGAFDVCFDIVQVRVGQKLAAQFEPGGAVAVGKKAILADRVDAVGQRLQEAVDELVRIERHDLRRSAVTIIPPAERDLPSAS